MDRHDIHVGQLDGGAVKTFVAAYVDHHATCQQAGAMPLLNCRAARGVVGTEPARPLLALWASPYELSQDWSAATPTSCASCGYLSRRDLVDPGLAGAVPAVGWWRDAGIRHGPARPAVQRLLESCDRSSTCTPAHLHAPRLPRAHRSFLEFLV